MLEVQINFEIFGYLGLICLYFFVCSLTCLHLVHCLLSGNLCSSAAIFHSVASLSIPLHYLVPQRNCISTPCLYSLWWPYIFSFVEYCELFYASNIILLSTDLFRSAIFGIGYITLNIMMDIKLPSLLGSILYLHNSVLWIVLVSSIAINNDYSLW